MEFSLVFLSHYSFTHTYIYCRFYRHSRFLIATFCFLDIVASSPSSFAQQTSRFSGRKTKQVNARSKNQKRNTSQSQSCLCKII